MIQGASTHKIQPDDTGSPACSSQAFLRLELVRIGQRLGCIEKIEFVAEHSMRDDDERKPLPPEQAILNQLHRCWNPKAKPLGCREKLMANYPRHSVKGDQLQCQSDCPLAGD